MILEIFITVVAVVAVVAVDVIITNIIKYFYKKEVLEDNSNTQTEQIQDVEQKIEQNVKDIRNPEIDDHRKETIEQKLELLLLQKTKLESEINVCRFLPDHEKY